MILTLNRKGASGTPEHGALRPFVFDGFVERYTGHPDEDVDLACVDVTEILLTDADVRQIGESYLVPIDYDKVAMGSDVLFVGYPNDFYDAVNNLPLLRKGIIASMPDIDFNGQGNVVIDAQVFGGSSGSPVFVGWNEKYRLLGVISSTAEGETPSGSPSILGLGIVIKQRHVRELIDHKTLELDS